MLRLWSSSIALLAIALLPRPAHAVRSAELYTATSYGYGRVEARIRFAAGDGVISSFFAWKEGSELARTFWNELDFEKLGADCHLETNPLYGNPAQVHAQKHPLPDLCTSFHTYAYEWTPEYIAWSVDGAEIRRETGETAAAFATNATGGMQIHMNVWPGDITFGGNFNPSILPVHQYVDWVQFSKYEGGAFVLDWREDFTGATVPSGWLTGNWPSPKNKSTHDPGNVSFIDGYAVLSLTADDAVGPVGADPADSGSSAGGTAGQVGGGGAPAGGTGGGASTTGGTAGSSSATPASPDLGGCSFVGAQSSRGGWAALLGGAFAALLLGRRRSSASKAPSSVKTAPLSE